MVTDHNATAAAAPSRPNGVPKLNLNGSLGKKSNKVAAGSSRNTPDNAASNTSKKSSSFSLQRTNSGDGRPSSAGQNSREPMMTPRGGSYRDILVTPRGSTRSLGEQLIASNRSSSRPSSSSRTSSAATTSIRQQDQQQQRALARASHEKTHVQQQISTLDAAIQAQQASLVDNIAVIQNLGDRRDRLAMNAAALQAAVARAHAAASTRQAEIQELEVLIESLQATFQISQNEEGNATTAVSTHKKALMQLMQAAAGALRLPSITFALEAELQKQTQKLTQQNTQINHQLNQSRGNGGGGGSRAITARSDISTSRFLTPAGTNREGGEDIDNDIRDNDSVVSSSSSEGDSLDSSRTGIAADDVPLATTLGGSNSTSISTTAKLNRPGMNVPLLQLPADTIPAHFNTQSSARLLSPNPQALARLQSIRSKLEAAELILTARVPEHGDELTA